MTTISAPRNRIAKPQHLFTALGLALTLACGVAIGWQVGEHRASSQSAGIEANAAAAPPILRMRDDESKETGSALISLPSEQVVPARGGASEAIADARTSFAFPERVVTLYLVDTQTEANSLQGIIDDANHAGELASGTAQIVVTDAAVDADGTSFLTNTIGSDAGMERVQVVDMRSTSPGR